MGRELAVSALALALGAGCAESSSVDGAAGSGASDAASDARDPKTCDASSVSGILASASAGSDPLGYPAYALDGCALVYVAAPEEAGPGELRLRDLATGVETTLAPGDETPRRPTLSGSVLAWESTVLGKIQVRIRAGGELVTFDTSFDHSGEPRATGDAVVFSAWLGASPDADTDVYLYDVTTKALTPIAAGPGQQRFADVSPSAVALSDFSEDPKGYFDETTPSLSDIVVVDRETGTVTVRSASGKQAFPLLGKAGRLVYLEWGEVHPEPKFSRFFLKIGNVLDPPELDRNVKGVDAVETNPAYVRPSLNGDALDFVDQSSGEPTLYRVRIDTQSEPLAAGVIEPQGLLSPVAGEQMTVLAKRGLSTSLELFAVPR